MIPQNMWLLDRCATRHPLQPSPLPQRITMYAEELKKRAKDTRTVASLDAGLAGLFSQEFSPTLNIPDFSSKIGTFVPQGADAPAPGSTADINLATGDNKNSSGGFVNTLFSTINSLGTTWATVQNTKAITGAQAALAKLGYDNTNAPNVYGTQAYSNQTVAARGTGPTTSASKVGVYIGIGAAALIIVAVIAGGQGNGKR